ncbi:MAG TPA: DUF2147 domain-containing protein [Pseudolabrys sp.]|nr:DUF2147 domain-containing protein [Pseudolabrys sp.]
MRVRWAASVLACFSVFAVMAVSGHAAPAQMPTAAGLWQQVDERGGKSLGWFLIYVNDQGLYEGAIAKMFIAPGENQNPICAHCQGEQKGRPSLGLTIIKNMQRNGLRYENGSILDPRDGDIYSARMELSPNGRDLTVRGFLGIDLFGRNQIWHRLPDSALASVDRSIIAAHARALLPLAGQPRPSSSHSQPRGPQTRGPQVR